MVRQCKPCPGPDFSVAIRQGDALTSVTVQAEGTLAREFGFLRNEPCTERQTLARRSWANARHELTLEHQSKQFETQRPEWQ